MGRFEVPAFRAGTDALLHALAAAHAAGAVTVAAGGDSVAALNAAGLSDAVTHVSTGGGASLQLLEGKSMPGLEALLG
jgi:phosphoglycerate kinase